MFRGAAIRGRRNPFSRTGAMCPGRPARRRGGAAGCIPLPAGVDRPASDATGRKRRRFRDVFAGPRRSRQRQKNTHLFSNLYLDPAPRDAKIKRAVRPAITAHWEADIPPEPNGSRAYYMFIIKIKYWGLWRTWRGRRRSAGIFSKHQPPLCTARRELFKTPNPLLRRAAGESWPKRGESPVANVAITAIFCPELCVARPAGRVAFEPENGTSEAARGSGSVESPRRGRSVFDRPAAIVSPAIVTKGGLAQPQSSAHREMHRLSSRRMVIYTDSSGGLSRRTCR
jgi:hypothetical protein